MRNTSVPTARAIRRGDNWLWPLTQSCQRWPEEGVAACHLMGCEVLTMPSGPSVPLKTTPPITCMYVCMCVCVYVCTLMYVCLHAYVCMPSACTHA